MDAILEVLFWKYYGLTQDYATAMQMAINEYKLDNDISETSPTVDIQETMEMLKNWVN